MTGLELLKLTFPCLDFKKKNAFGYFRINNKINEVIKVKHFYECNNECIYCVVRGASGDYSASLILMHSYFFFTIYKKCQYRSFLKLHAHGLVILGFQKV